MLCLLIQPIEIVKKKQQKKGCLFGSAFVIKEKKTTVLVTSSLLTRCFHLMLLRGRFLGSNH
jgi:hypothetical protein